MRHQRNKNPKQQSKHRPDSGSLLSGFMSSTKLPVKGLMVCSGMLGLLMVAMFCPTAHDQANAEGGVAPLADEPPQVSVSLQRAVELNLTPSSAGAFGAGAAEVRVSTSNSDGYAVYIHAENGQNALVDSKGHRVEAVSGAMVPGSFGSNTWGYAFGQNLDLNATTYQALPTDTTTAIKTKDTSVTSSATDTYTLAFGAKINTTLPSGEYKNNVIVSVIANPKKVTSLTGLTYMQEMTSEVCEGSTTGDSKSLVDSRDGKSYTVFKAKDGNCWMRTNLAVTGTVPKAKVTGGTDGTYTLTENTNYWNKNSSYGMYYKFDAVTADTSTTISPSYFNATASICPTGGEADANWVLPKNGQSGSVYSGVGSFSALLNAHGGQTFAVATGAELGLQLGGIVDTSGSMIQADTSGGYWYRTAYLDYHDAYRLGLDSRVPSVTPVSYNSRSYGMSVRCLYPSTSTKAAVQAQ